MMHSICEACEEKEAQITCHSCTKLHLFCQPCFEFTHNSDCKRLHQSEMSVIVSKDEEASQNISFCDVHSNKVNTYACLTCNIAVCPDCLVVGDHKGHDIETFQKGFEKSADEFKANLAEFESCLKIVIDKKDVVLDSICDTIKKIEELKKQTDENFQRLVQEVETKRSDILSFIDKEILNLAENKETLSRATTEFMMVIEECKQDIAKSSKVDYGEYNKFASNVRELKKLKSTFAKWLPAVQLVNARAFYPLSLALVSNSLASIKLNQNLFNYDVSFMYSNSIIKTVEHHDLLLDWLSDVCDYQKIDLKLLWKGSLHGFEAATFHHRCDGMGPTLTVIASDKGYVFGGYTSKPWAGNCGYVYDPKAFIFSLTNKTKHAKQLDKQYSIYCGSSYGPTFGEGNDIYIRNNCNDTGRNSSKGNTTYELPAQANRKTYLAGAHHFVVKDIEVYSVSLK